MNWISVEDSLPEEGKRCLIYGEDRISIGKYDSPIWHEDEWDRDYGCPKITHWMPFPEEPVELKEEEDPPTAMSPLPPSAYKYVINQMDVFEKCRLWLKEGDVESKD
jgi:hypothetical protein